MAFLAFSMSTVSNDPSPSEVTDTFPIFKKEHVLSPFEIYYKFKKQRKSLTGCVYNLKITNTLYESSLQ